MRKFHTIGFLAISLVIVSMPGLNEPVNATDTVPPTVAPELPTTTTLPPPLSPRDIIKISRVRTRDKVVFITIDDGATVSRELARVIDKNEVPITTFAMPGMLWRSREWYRARENMSFQNHTNTHAHMTLISHKKQVIELCHSNKLIRRMFGKRPTMYRPPRGSWSEKNRKAMAKCGLKYAVLWSVVITNYVPENIQFRRGEIILLHYVPSLPRVLEELVEELKAQKLEPALLEDYLK